MPKIAPYRTNRKKNLLKYLRQNSGRHFTKRELVRALLEKHPEDYERKRRDSKATYTDTELINQLVAEIGTLLKSLGKLHPGNLITVEDRPTKFYWRDRPEGNESPERDALTRFPASETDARLPKKKDHEEEGPREEDLYEPLRQYLFRELDVCSMRINEKKSSNTGGTRANEWLHPDIVGMENLVANRNNKMEIERLAEATSTGMRKLWSLEVKSKISRSTVREAFFQAVSNSSWANIGYLVVNRIEGRESQQESTMRELRMLAEIHGIGVIQVDKENPDEKNGILIPARQRPTIDLATCDRLAENKDFLEFIEKVRAGLTDKKTWGLS